LWFGGGACFWALKLAVSTRETGLMIKLTSWWERRCHLDAVGPSRSVCSWQTTPGTAMITRPAAHRIQPTLNKSFFFLILTRDLLLLCSSHLHSKRRTTWNPTTICRDRCQRYLPVVVTFERVSDTCVFLHCTGLSKDEIRIISYPCLKTLCRQIVPFLLIILSAFLSHF